MQEDLLLKARSAMDLSQREFAPLVGVHYATIGKIEGGSYTLTPTLAALCRMIIADPDLALRTLVKTAPRKRREPATKGRPRASLRG